MKIQKRKTVDVITMGCSKNLVDSERLLRLFADAGFRVRHNPDNIGADEVVINTCGFIGDAKQESIDMILQCCRAKADGRVGKVTVMGCLSQRYMDDLPGEIPEVDRWYGKFEWKKVAADLGAPSKENSDSARFLTTPSHHAYIKISEGCNRFCAFCAIPLITGRHISRTEEDILGEVERLATEGVSEFNIIAQDLSSYGKDIYGRSALAGLLDKMASVKGVRRIRLHYAYPADFPLDILPVMRRHANICNYLDIALQHISDSVLQNMRRHIDAKETFQLLDTIRREVPGIHLRTTLMVGFPGEGDKEFQELLDFVRMQRFERLGAFSYSEEDDTYAALHFDDIIPDDVKQRRLSELMSEQEKISLEINEAKIGHTLEVVIDKVEGEFYVGRTEFDSPEVDPEVYIKKKVGMPELKPGEYYNVKITDAMPFDLIGEVVS